MEVCSYEHFYNNNLKYNITYNNNIIIEYNVIIQFLSKAILEK